MKKDEVFNVVELIRDLKKLTPIMTNRLLIQLIKFLSDEFKLNLSNEKIREIFLNLDNAPPIWVKKCKNPCSECKKIYDLLKIGVEEGSRDITAFELTRRLKNHALTKEETITKLLEWNKFNKPPLPEKEILKKIEIAFKNRPVEEICGIIELKAKNGKGFKLEKTEGWFNMFNENKQLLLKFKVGDSVAVYYSKNKDYRNVVTIHELGYNPKEVMKKASIRQKNDDIWFDENFRDLE